MEPVLGDAERQPNARPNEEVANAMRYVAGKALLGIMVVYKTYDSKEGAEVVEDPGWTGGAGSLKQRTQLHKCSMQQLLVTCFYVRHTSHTQKIELQILIF